MKRVKKKLELQRTTLVELTPKQLAEVSGGGGQTLHGGGQWGGGGPKTRVSDLCL